MNIDIIYLNQNNHRKVIGFSGMGLPFILFAVLAVSGYYSPLFSISHYYFTRANACVYYRSIADLHVFTDLPGKGAVDRWASTLAGVAGLVLLMFPTNNISDVCNDPAHPYSITQLPESSLRSLVHYGAAAVFLSSLAFMSLFIFTKSNVPPVLRTGRKKIRNRIYRICGAIMLAAIAFILSNFLGLTPDSFFVRYHATFWMENIAIEAFGFSWIVKAEAILSDLKLQSI